MQVDHAGTSDLGLSARGCCEWPCRPALERETYVDFLSAVFGGMENTAVCQTLGMDVVKRIGAPDKVRPDCDWSVR